MKSVAIIPARGGSKRIPGKNIRPFNGIPALSRTIMSISSSNEFDHIFVSTDSEEVAEVARRSGGEVIVRSRELAGDHSGILEVVQHDLNEILSAGLVADLVACVLPTAVLLSPDDLVSASRMVRESGSDFVVAVSQFEYPVQRAVRINEVEILQMVWPDNYEKRSQDLEVLFHDAGQFYIGTPDRWLSRKTMFDNPARAYRLESWRVQDIDDEDDWKRAELIAKLIRD